MGSLILCHKKRAKRPFEISRVHMRIYTIEELCYSICNNLYLIHVIRYLHFAGPLGCVADRFPKSAWKA